MHGERVEYRIKEEEGQTERKREREKRKERPDERWNNPMSGQRRRSETADSRDVEGDETAHEGKGVATKLSEDAGESEMKQQVVG